MAKMLVYRSLIFLSLVIWNELQMIRCDRITPLVVCTLLVAISVNVP